MSHLYDTIEPNVINEALLRQCIVEQGPEGEAGRLAKQEGIDFVEVTQLRLDFQNILRIENLWQFTNLRKLQLDNNIIEEVPEKALESLTQLEWLDLSFNNIENIAGLDKLVSLRDLSLAHNRIKTVCNLDALTKLQVLSLANNLIEETSEWKNLRYLRRVSSLQSLALKGNPLTQDEFYRLAVVAFVPSLIYVDFSMIMEEEREEAMSTFHDTLDEIEHTERDEAHMAEQQRAIDELESLHRAAYVDGIVGSELFKTLFLEDGDAERFALLPDVPDMLKEYEQSFTECCEHLIKVGLAEKEKRDKEHDMFKVAHTEACTQNQQQSVERVKEFEKLKQKLMAEMSRGGGGGGEEEGVASEADQLREAIERLQHDLMKLEMHLVEQIDEISKDFDRNFNDQVGNFKEQLQAHMTQLRDFENNHHEKVTELAVTILEKMAKNQLEEELHDDLRMFFVDKDTLVSALNNSHDTHMLAIDNKEDVIVRRITTDSSALLQTIVDNEHTRNRQKVVEIDRYIEYQRDEVESLEVISPQP